MKPLVLSPAALDDLDGISSFIGQDNPDRAVSFIAELESKVRQAAERPQSFPARDDIAPGLRSNVYKNYLILFRELEDEVRIVHVVHGRRDLHALDYD